METTRIFIGLIFPEEVNEEIFRVQKLIHKKWNFTGKTIEQHNLHLTLNFIGEVDETKLKVVQDVLRDIKFNSFEVYLGNLGVFSYNSSPKILWNKLCGKNLFELQLIIQSNLEKKGFKFKERFVPHISLARLKYVKDKTGFIEYVNNTKIKPLKFNIDKFYLFKSELKPIGPEYSILEEYALN